MSIEGQGHFFTIYFPGFVCFVLYLDKISGEHLQDHWSSGCNRGYDCAMIGQTQLFLWPRYSDIILLLTITVQGYQISIAYCLFFISFVLSIIIRYIPYLILLIVLGN